MKKSFTFLASIRNKIFNIHYCYKIKHRKGWRICVLIKTLKTKAFLIQFSLKNFNWNIVQKIIDSTCGLKFTTQFKQILPRTKIMRLFPLLLLSEIDLERKKNVTVTLDSSWLRLLMGVEKWRVAFEWFTRKACWVDCVLFVECKNQLSEFGFFGCNKVFSSRN